MSEKITCVKSDRRNVLLYSVIAQNTQEAFALLDEELGVAAGRIVLEKTVTNMTARQGHPSIVDVEVTLGRIDDYHSDRSRICNSQLSLLKESPKQYYDEYVLGKRREQTAAMLRGSMVHTLVFEPEKYALEYHIVNASRRDTRAFHEAGDTFVDHTCVLLSQHNEAERIANAVLSHPEFSKCMSFIDADAKIEQRIDFDWHGIASRCKLDLLLPNRKLCIDLKTTADALPEGFAKSVATFGYHRQQAFYSEAIKQHYGEEFRFLFAVVETSEPYNTAVYELDAASVDAGRQEINLLLDELERRTRDNDWTPEYSKGIVTLTLPRWYKSNIYEVE